MARPVMEEGTSNWGTEKDELSEETEEEVGRESGRRLDVAVTSSMYELVANEDDWVSVLYADDVKSEIEDDAEAAGKAASLFADTPPVLGLACEDQTLLISLETLLSPTSSPPPRTN